MKPDLEVCGEAGDLAGALTLAETTHPDVAVVDLLPKTGNGLDLLKQLKGRQPAMAMLVWRR